VSQFLAVFGIAMLMWMMIALTISAAQRIPREIAASDDGTTA